jgi:hypothetical protein
LLRQIVDEVQLGIGGSNLQVLNETNSIGPFCTFFSIFHLQKVATLTTPQFETSVLLCGTSASLHDIGSDARGKKNRLLDTAQHLAQREVSIFSLLVVQRCELPEFDQFKLKLPPGRK